MPYSFTEHSFQVAFDFSHKLVKLRDGAQEGAYLGLQYLPTLNSVNLLMEIKCLCTHARLAHLLFFIPLSLLTFQELGLTIYPLSYLLH